MARFLPPAVHFGPRVCKKRMFNMVNWVSQSLNLIHSSSCGMTDITIHNGAWWSFGSFACEQNKNSTFKCINSGGKCHFAFDFTEYLLLMGSKNAQLSTLRSHTAMKYEKGVACFRWHRTQRINHPAGFTLAYTFPALFVPLRSNTLINNVRNVAVN